jgi:hypothetical protein
MKYTIQLVSKAGKTVLDFFATNKTLSATIIKWATHNTTNSLEKNSPFMLLTGVAAENNFAPANE